MYFLLSAHSEDFFFLFPFLNKPWISRETGPIQELTPDTVDRSLMQKQLSQNLHVDACWSFTTCEIIPQRADRSCKVEFKVKVQ